MLRRAIRRLQWNGPVRQRRTNLKNRVAVALQLPLQRCQGSMHEPHIQHLGHATIIARLHPLHRRKHAHIASFTQISIGPISSSTRAAAASTASASETYPRTKSTKRDAGAMQTHCLNTREKHEFGPTSSRDRPSQGSNHDASQEGTAPGVATATPVGENLALHLCAYATNAVTYVIIETVASRRASH